MLSENKIKFHDIARHKQTRTIYVGEENAALKKKVEFNEVIQEVFVVCIENVSFLGETVCKCIVIFHAKEKY